MVIEVDVLRVFTGPDGRHGNPLGVVRTPPALDPAQRQAVAAELGYSETVFVDDASTGRVSIFTPAVELPFAGHPLVGTAWLLAETGRASRVLRPPAGAVQVRAEGELTWIRGDPSWSPQREVRQYPEPAEIDQLRASDVGFDLYAWTWLDEGAGRVRARYLAPGLGVEEDEATGSAAVLLGSRLGRELTIEQGAGSVLYVRPRPDGMVEVGGRVVRDATRRLG